MKIREWVRDGGFWACALLAVLYAGYLAFSYADQPPLDVHAFRQAQTALTAYWFTQDGVRLAYETPVAGYPWAIPFEFPLYQALVAWSSMASGVSLDIVGRVWSFAFLLACVFPVWSIIGQLKLPRATFFIFCALVFSSPVYIYWGRTFMIETAALFLALLAVKFFVDLLEQGVSGRRMALFAAAMSLALLQKATTALPVLGILAFVWFVREFRRWKENVGEPEWARRTVLVFVCFVLPVVIGYFWVSFTDQVKLSSPLGGHLSSAALSKWNWGTLEQRFSTKLFVDVLWGRMFQTNLGGWLGAFLIVLPLFVKHTTNLRAVGLVCLGFGILPLFVFTNLHLVHDYYQSAMLIFMMFGIAVSLACVVLPKFGAGVTLLTLIFLSVSNYSAFVPGYLPFIQQKFNKDNRDVAIGAILQRELPSDKQFVVFGNDWSSTLAYMARRKSFAVPDWFEGRGDVVSNPEKFVEPGELGAVVSCSSQSLGFSALSQIAVSRSWKIGEALGCIVVSPQKQMTIDRLRRSQCQAAIDQAQYENREGVPVLAVWGWAAPAGLRGEVSPEVFVVISGPNGQRRHVEALRIPRRDVNTNLHVSDDDDAGFSALIPLGSTRGAYSVELALVAAEGYSLCQFEKTVVISE